MNTPNASFEYICGLSVWDPLLTTAFGVETQVCAGNTRSSGNSNPCMLLQPSDIVAVSPTLLYVTYYQGITQLDLSTSPATCLQVSTAPLWLTPWPLYGGLMHLGEQVAGLGNDLAETQMLGNRDGIMVSTATVGGLVAPTSPMSLLNELDSTLLNYPYRLSFSLYRGRYLQLSPMLLKRVAVARALDTLMPPAYTQHLRGGLLQQCGSALLRPAAVRVRGGVCSSLFEPHSPWALYIGLTPRSNAGVRAHPWRQQLLQPFAAVGRPAAAPLLAGLSQLPSYAPCRCELMPPLLRELMRAVDRRLLRAGGGGDVRAPLLGGGGDGARWDHSLRRAVGSARARGPFLRSGLYSPPPPCPPPQWSYGVTDAPTMKCR